MTEEEKNDPWSEAPPDIADRVARLLSRLLAEQFDAKVTVAAGKPGSQLLYCAGVRKVEEA